jgi:hypothetical protein
MADQHTAWRYRLGTEVAEAYAADAAVAATAIGGSVARGWSDPFSDVEVFVFWRKSPDEAQRNAAVKRSGGNVDVDWTVPNAQEQWRGALEATGGYVGELWPYQDHEWSEHFYVDGVNVGVSGFHLETVERWICRLIDDCRPNDDAQILAAAITHGREITGTDHVKSWRGRLAKFPVDLVRAIVSPELWIDQSWWNVRMLAARNDRPAADLLFVRMVQRIIRCLLAVNRRYLPDPKPKWTRQLLLELERTPEDIADRIEAVWSAPTDQAAVHLQSLFDDTLDLLEANVAGLDVASARRWFRHRRAVWDGPPRRLLDAGPEAQPSNR